MNPLVSAFAAVVLAVPLMVVLLWLRGLVLLSFLAWFVAPVWPSLPPVPMYAAMGLVLLPQVLGIRHDTGDDKDRGPFASLARSTAVSLVTSGALWLMGAAVVWVSR
jgi:hypothetical protein